MKKKTEYRTVSLPRPLADDIQKFIEQYGYWNSIGAFVREAAVAKLKKERRELEFVPVPVLAFEPEEERE